MSSSGCSHGNTPGLRDDSNINNDGTQPPDDNDGDIGDTAPPAIEEPQGQRETQRSFSPFTEEDVFTHATQDEGEGVVAINN